MMQLGLVSLEQQLQNRLSSFHGLAGELQNVLVLLVVVVICSFCSVLDLPCGSSHEPAARSEFLSEPGCIACGFAEDLQCGLNALKPGKRPTAEHLGLLEGADEEQGMW